MYPPFSGLNRICTKDYKLPGTNIVIEKGTIIIIPSIGLHYDPKYFEQPDKFMPERFDENIANKKSFVEMPTLAFGSGPRNCIALRLAMLQTKIAIVLMLQKFQFELGDEHKNKPLKLNVRSRITAPLNGINLKVKAR